MSNKKLADKVFARDSTGVLPLDDLGEADRWIRTSITSLGYVLPRSFGLAGSLRVERRVADLESTVLTTNTTSPWHRRQGSNLRLAASFNVAVILKPRKWICYHPVRQGQQGSNLRHSNSKSDALPAELCPY